MAKRLTDTEIWKKQRWFRKLPPLYKLAWKYITDNCNHAGIYKLDYGELIDDLSVEDFDIKDFIDKCNSDFSKENGEKIIKERLKLINSTTIWITGFIKFQYEKSDFLINPKVPVVYSALENLEGYDLLLEGLNKGYFTLMLPYKKGMLRTKDKDKDI